ncbi:MAG: proline dehydrogenase family protein [Crocinitomicaceae bacterium]|nr:proline dehydrogenase family protein [Crocinitomicaceae bacterium]
MLSFENTKIAFDSKTNKELQWAYRLFKLIGKPWLVKLGDFSQRIAFKLRLPVNGVIKKTIFRQFCGGETINECEKKISVLSEYKIGAILDYSVEGMENETELDLTRDEIISTISTAKTNDNIPFAVFKVTGICKTDVLEKVNDCPEELSESELEEWDRAKQRVHDICSSAKENDVPIFIDAEDSWFQDAIDIIAEEMMSKFNKKKPVIYTTIQIYRHDRLDYLISSLARAHQENYFLGIKLVRGAYMEKEEERALEKGYPSPIQKNKEATDRDFNAALKFMCENLDLIWFCAGTHNEYSSAYLVDLMDELNISKNDKRIYFSQLLGMSDHISFNLAHLGYNVVKYVPYGPVKKVMPYLLRRVQENSSAAGQSGRELTLILKERNRRKS